MGRKVERKGGGGWMRGGIVEGVKKMRVRSKGGGGARYERTGEKGKW